MKKFLILMLCLLPAAAHAQNKPSQPPLPYTPQANMKAPSNLGAPAPAPAPGQLAPPAATPAPEAAEKTPPDEYVPFPMNFDAMDDASKSDVLKSVDANTEKYFRSKEYGMALARFVETVNPQDIHECHTLSMDRAANKINVIEPLLFARATDKHPMVGKWEQNASFTGCNKTYAFVIHAESNKGREPILSLKP